MRSTVAACAIMVLLIGTADAEECPPGALGVSRTPVVDANEHSRVGSMQYPETLPLNDHEVVLTFDDGPVPRYTSGVLEILASECVKATFFMVGQMARAYPWMVRRVYDEGHTVANHTQNHPIRKMSVDQAAREIEEGFASLREAIGDPQAVSPFFRIPGLLRQKSVEQYLAAHGDIRGGCGFRPVRGCWNHMNDLVPAAFEVVENFGQREDGAGVNVVQQQDALAARLDTADGASRNLAVVDAGPIVCQEIRAPSHIAMGCEVLLDRLLAQQTRYPKERRHRLRVPDGLAQRRKTLFDLARRLIHSHFANGVVLGVVGDGVALVVNAPHHPRIGARHLPDHEEGRLHTFRCENLEDAVGVTR